MKQREFLAQVGEHFVTLTGGRAGLESGPDITVPLGYVTLACSLVDRTIRVHGSVFRPTISVLPSSVAVQIADAFDCRPRSCDAVDTTALAEYDLEDLERLTLERVRRDGADLLGSLSVDSRFREVLRPLTETRERGPGMPA